MCFDRWCDRVTEILVGGLICFFRFIMRKVTAKHSGAAMDNLLRRAADILRVFFIGKMVGAPWDGNLDNQPHIHLISRGYVLGISPLKGLCGGLQLGYHPEGTPVVPVILGWLDCWRMCCC